MPMRWMRDYDLEFGAPSISKTNKRIIEMAKTKKSRNKYSVSPPKGVFRHVYLKVRIF